MTPLSKEALRARIDALECVSDVLTAISDVESVEWKPNELHVFAINVMAEQAVTFVHRVPQSVLLAGLRAMERELLALADVREVAA